MITTRIIMSGMGRVCLAIVLASYTVIHAAEQPTSTGSGQAASTGSVQAYPTRPIRLIMPYPAGSSSNDIMGRALTLRLTAQIGQQIVFDNRTCCDKWRGKPTIELIKEQRGQVSILFV